MEVEVILAATITLTTMVLVIIMLFAIFQSRKNKFLKAEQKFQNEISKSQIEINEQALKNISWELHDNIGQLLSTAILQLNILHARIEEAHGEEIQDINQLVSKSLNEIRLLSRTLNHETVGKMGIVRSVQMELERFEKLKFLQTELVVTGEEKRLTQQNGIIIFRILQEFFANVIKHSMAQHLYVRLEFGKRKLHILAQDDGVGFDEESVLHGSGLINMKSRSEMIGASCTFDSAPNKGVILSIDYTYKK